MQRIGDELVKIKDLLRHHPQGLTITDIAQKFGKNKHTIGRYLDILYASGHVEMRTIGMAKVYTFSSRVPLSTLLSYSADFVLVLDQNLRIVQINDPFLSTLKIVRNDALLQQIKTIPCDDPALRSFLNQIEECILSGGDGADITLNTDPKKYFHLKVIPSVFEDGTHGTTVILEDVTQIRTAMQEVKKSEDFFRSVTDNISDGVVVIEGSQIIFVSDRACEILGYSREELMHMDRKSTIHPRDIERFKQAELYIEENPDAVKEIRYWAIHKDGSDRYLHVRMSQVHYGDTIRKYILITDITDWQVQEERRANQFELIKHLMNQHPCPLFIYEPDGSFIMVNAAFCELVGQQEDQVTGALVKNIIQPELYQDFIRGDEELKPLPDHQHRTIRLIDKEGITRSIRASKSVLQIGEGKKPYVFGIILEGFCKKFHHDHDEDEPPTTRKIDSDLLDNDPENTGITIRSCSD